MRVTSFPRIIHQYWDHGPIPSDAAVRSRSWGAKHPGWEHRIWRADTAASFLHDRFGSEAERCFHACVVPAMRADVLRIAAILVHGGVYADIDTLCRRSIDDLTGGSGTLYRARGRQSGKDKIMNQLIVARPGEVLFERAWDQLLRNIQADDGNGVSRTTGPIMLTTVWHKRLSPGDRRRYRLIDRAEMIEYLEESRRLSFQVGNGNWARRARRGPIVDFAAAESAMAATDRGVA